MAVVAPFAGAWIEIAAIKPGKEIEIVAPFAGAWIEITNLCYLNLVILSLPSRERGLKLTSCACSLRSTLVAPFAGAWIEILPLESKT